jgi:SAM-dependent methyltransferase
MGARANAVCVGCGSLERHRALATVADEKLRDGTGKRCLEAGPLNPKVYGDYLRDRDWTYTSIDRWRSGNPRDPRAVGFIDEEVDLSDLTRFDDGAFDLFIAQHVFEEIPDYERALAETRRVLGRAGLALMEIPFERSRATSVRQPADRFGNVWAFGADLLDRVAEVFDQVVAVPIAEGDYRGELLVCVTG